MEMTLTRYNSYDCAMDKHRTFSPADLATIAAADREIDQWFTRNVRREKARLRHNEQVKANYQKNHEARLAYHAAYRAANRDEINLKNRERKRAKKMEAI